jgi:citronellol/citronellal dehydrogenase
MTDNTPRYGFTDDELAAQETAFRDGLFAGKVALVSGGATGLGKAIAFLYARLGATIVLCGRSEEKLAAGKAALARYDVDVMTQAMTIRDAEQVEALFDSAQDRFGGIDILVNNAGGQFPQAAIDFSVKGWNAVIDTNLNGSWYMMQSAAKRWRDQGKPGCIVNIVADFWRGMPGIAHTAAARAGVVYLSKSIAIEWAPYNIRVNCVAPGCCETEAFSIYPPAGAATFEESNPMLHAGDAVDIAEACAYLSASSGKFITGEVVTVDGGQQLWGDPWAIGRPDYFKLK